MIADREHQKKLRRRRAANVPGDGFPMLHAGIGTPELAVAVPAAVLDGPLGRRNEDLRALWKQDGWARYGAGLLWTVDPRAFADVIADWPGAPGGAVVFARTAFADLYLCSPGHVLHLDVVRGRFMPMAAGEVYLLLNHSVPKLSYRRETLEKHGLFAKLRAKLGDLDPDECYGMFPALALGGRERDPKCYRRVKLREYLAICAQLVG